ncbi:MAG: Fis family transcriptional regulator [Acidobacteria bacterium]|nr:MAG: Fis family transcriptional regulator [Acidobacteriota bacterium]
MTKTLFVVDDEQSMCRFFELTFTHLGYRVITASGVSEAVGIIDKEKYDVLLTDMKMEDGQGLEVLEASKKKNPDTPVLIMTAYASTDTAIEAMKLGASDYLTKPFNVEEVKLVIENQVRTSALVKENIQLKKQLKQVQSFEFISNSEVMRPVLAMIDRVAQLEATVLVQGESGTGKELIMRMIHEKSNRSQGPFIAINCGALPENLLESELFGYEKGAFTGADQQKMGLFEAAKGGTLFLDEIGELPLHMQVKLLRVLQEGKIRRVGGQREINIDMRIVAATNRDLEEEVTEGRFREDLFYRINVVPIELPPLRQRSEDIPLLVHHFVHRFCSKYSEPIKEIHPEVMSALLKYQWPGNVRELENTVERLIALTVDTVVRMEHLSPKIRQVIGAPIVHDISIPEVGFNLEDHLEGMREAYLKKSLKICDGVQTKAAELLGISFRSFRYYLSKVKK